MKVQEIAVKIDGKIIKTSLGKTVLRAAKETGIYIPTLCFLENIKPYGGCRLCVVEIKNMKGYPTACSTPVEPGMEITTYSENLQSLRRNILGLILSEHPYTCLVCKEKSECKEFMTTTRKVTTTTGCNFCPNNGKCEMQNIADYLELKDVGFPITYRNINPVKDNPFYEFDYNLCVLCGRCVRICNDERHSNVLSFVRRGNETLVGTAFNKTHLETGCEYCGACVDVCPTGSISEKIGKWFGNPDKSVKTICPYCSVACDININVRGNHIVNVGPDAENRTNPPQICVRGKFTIPDLVHHPSRIKKPFIRKGDKWIESTWDEAINFTASNLERYRGSQFGLIGSSHDTLENNYTLQKFSRTVMRSNNVDLFPSIQSNYTLNAIHNYHNVFSPVDINEIIDADALLLIGSQAYLSHPIIENRIRKAYSNNEKKIISANALHSLTSRFATQNVFYNPGEEQNFLLSLLFHLIKEKHKSIPDELKNVFEKFNPELILNKTSVKSSELQRIIKDIDSAEKLIIIVGDGILRNSDNNFNILYKIQLLLNNPENCRIIFLLNEGNYYGGTLMGMNPEYLPGFNAVTNEKNWSESWKTRLNNIKGLSSDEMINNVADDGITALFVKGDIPTHPNLANLKFFVQQNMFFTDVTKYANVFFPVTHFAELDGHIINIENKLKKLNRVIAPMEDVKDTWYVMCRLAEKMFEKGFKYENTDDIFNEITSLGLTSVPETKHENNKFLPVNIELKEKTNGFSISVIIENNNFHYTGNILSLLIPDMKIIRDEGILFLSPELARQLDVKNSDDVRFTTELGKTVLKVKILRDLTGTTAYFKPNNESVGLFSKGFNIDKDYFYANIEKE